MANITIATTDTWLPEVWSTAILATLHKNTVMGQPGMTDRRYEAMLASISPGDLIRVPTVAELTANKLTGMTGTLTFSANTEAATTNIAVNVLGYMGLKIDKASTRLNYLNVVELYSEEAGRALAQLLDTDVLAEMDTTSTVKGTDNIPLTDDVILDSMSTLDTNNVWKDDRKFVHSPKMKADLYVIEKFVNNLYAAAVGNLQASKGRGFTGRIYDFDMYETTNLPSGVAGKKGFMYHPSGIALVLAQDIIVERRQPHDELADAIIPWGIWGVKLMAAARVVEVDGR